MDRAVALLVAGWLLGGCGSAAERLDAASATSTSEAPPDPANTLVPSSVTTEARAVPDLHGQRLFRFLSVDGSDVALSASRLLLDLRTDGTWSLQGCNAVGGRHWVVDASSLILDAGDGAGSAVGCSPDGERLDAAVHRLIGIPLAWSLSGEVLVLDGDGVHAELEDVATADPLDAVVLHGDGWELGYDGDAVVCRGACGAVSFAIPGEPLDGSLIGNMPEGDLLFAVLPAGGVRATFVPGDGRAAPDELDVYAAPNDMRMAAQLLHDAGSVTVVAYDADGREVGRRTFVAEMQAASAAQPLQPES